MKNKIRVVIADDHDIYLEGLEKNLNAANDIEVVASALNGKNYEYLKEQLKMTGFGETLHAELANKISQGTPEFQLTQKNTYGSDTAYATLHFKKGAESDMYFFNRYELLLQNHKQENKNSQLFL